MTAAGSPPPGWYPDPGGESVQRWWDGSRWTDHTQIPAQLRAPMSEAEARNWALAAHLSAIGAAFLALAFLGPLVVYLVKRDDHPFVHQHATEALNFNVSMLIYAIVGTFVTVLLSLVLIGLLLIPLLIAGGVVWLVLCIVGGVKAGRGETFRYPFTIRFVR